MNFGVFVPNFGDYYDPRTLAELAHEAEASGWDGFFIMDHMSLGRSDRFADPWVALAAIAVHTERIRIGPMVTPLPRRRPWKLARETVSLDHLSNGRLILGVGSGSPRDTEFESFGEDGDLKVRARKLDEGLDVLTGLWSGEPFSYQSEHYRLEETVFLPKPVQSPRIPVWVAGTWPHKAPLRRAERWDGYFPERTTPTDIHAVVAHVDRYRPRGSVFDVAFGNRLRADQSAELADVVAAYAEAGLTWWMQRLGPTFGTFGESRARIQQGPPGP